MNCGEKTIKYLLFILNLVFLLCGLALVICGILLRVIQNYFPSEVQISSSTLAIGVIVLGCIISVIAFFGCFGAILENRCMIIAFGILALIILIIQIALSVYLLVALNRMDDCDVDYEYEKVFKKYWVDNHYQPIVDFVQASMRCCGIDEPDDYMKMPNSTGKYPWSCCRLRDLNFETCEEKEVFRSGCSDRIIYTVRSLSTILGGIILGIVGVESIGIMFAFGLVYSLRNTEQRARVV